jgi:hypothetical protein
MSKEKNKDPNAVALGQKGGKARTQKLSPERRRDIAQKAALARWAKTKTTKEKK